MTDTQVVITGGGIGGIGAALMLGRRGISVTVLERDPELTEGGFGLQLGPNITRMLKREGVFDEIAPLMVFPKRLAFRNATTGAFLNYLDCDDFERRYGSRYAVMHRNDLLQALARGARATGNVTIINSAKVTEFADHGDHVSVRTDAGAEVTGQVLLAADGIHSLVRRTWHGDAVVPTGYVAYRGTLPEDRLTGEFDFNDLTLWMGPGLHFIQYGLRDGHELNQVAVFRSPAYERGEEDWGGVDELSERFQGLFPPVEEGVKGLSMVRGWPMVDREPLETYVRGRVALLGDAAHATLQYLAQGAGQSLLDGSSLATNLAALGDGPWSDDEVARAFAAYDAERVPQASRVQATSRFWGEMWHVDTVGAVMLRDHLFATIDRYDYKLYDWLYGPALEEGGAGGASLDALETATVG
ncbi:3-hydroxybenzoate 6-hydroxylase [Gryllotalpicola daejeonensis]|uniref:3-hydroxybenzoate 6-hydroxylase n=1 Tax=Gryllotalpicola daejeonensis TaxID=993087 RepID=A0ABP7ZN29_9MICO